MVHKSMTTLSLAELAQRLRDGTLSAEALAQYASAAHAEHDLEAYRAFDSEQLVRQAQAADKALGVGADLGALQGIPCSVKDLYGLAGFRTYAGSPHALPARWEQDAALVATARRQLAVLAGKTHTVEFAFGGIGTNPHWPTPRNPWDAGAHRVPGGSSSGAGVSLAEGSAFVALGTDTAGSVRIPASFTGQVGLKTSVGRWSTDGIVPLSPTLDTPGVLTRSVADLTYAFGALDPRWSGPRALHNALDGRRVAELRLALGEMFFWQACADDVADVVRQAVDALVGRGARLLDAPELDAPAAHALFRQGGPVAPELHAFLQHELPAWRASLDPNVAARVTAGAELSASDYLQRLQTLRRLAAAADAALQQVDAVLTPTVPIPPPTRAEVASAEAYRAQNLLALRNTSVVNYLGLCAISLPVGLDSRGLPVGMQLIGRHGREEALLAAACAIERALGTPRQRLGQAPLGV